MKIVVKQDPIPPDEKPDNLEKLLAELKASNDRIAKIVTPSRRQGGSVLSYYSEDYARQLADTLDHLAETRTPQLIKLHDNASINTLKQRISQARKYILDFLDEDGKYAKLFVQIDFNWSNAGPHAGVTLRFKQGYFLQTTSLIDWRAELNKFMQEAPPNSKFEKTGLALSDEDLNYLEALLGAESPVADLYHSNFNNTSMIVIKI